MVAQSAADKSGAVALYDEAENLEAAGNFLAACPKYAESNRLDSSMFRLDEGDLRFERIEFRLKPTVAKAGDLPIILNIGAMAADTAPDGTMAMPADGAMDMPMDHTMDAPAQ